MVSQILDKYSWLKRVQTPLRFIESLPMRFAKAVLPVCDALAKDVQQYRKDNVVILKDVSLIDPNVDDAGVEILRDTLSLQGKLAMYIGNLEAYQGIEFLLHGFACYLQKFLDADLIIIGGSEKHIRQYQGMAQQLGIAPRVHFMGQRPVAHIGAYMAQADVLVSPRLQGVNTPMKIYSYLHSGVVVVATALPTHTQVMNDSIAMLVPAKPEKLAAALAQLFQDAMLRRLLGEKARAYIEKEHSFAAFKQKLNKLYRQLERNTGTDG